MKVLAWNLHHQATRKAIPDGLGGLFASLGVDVVLLNEFVDGPTRTAFRASLKSAGYAHHLLSASPARPAGPWTSSPRHNQVLAAAKFPMLLGDIEPPALDDYAQSNFLHIRFAHTPIEVVGLRAPAYPRKAVRDAYWAQLLDILNRVSERPIAFAGDVNRNPFAETGATGFAPLRFPGCERYSVASPTGQWSFISSSGAARGRIDHVLYTALLEVSGARYVTEHAGIVLAGPKPVSPNSCRPVSDHAALVFSVETTAVRPDNPAGG